MTPAGALTLVGRLTEASNATFLAADTDEQLWVYKPVAGEVPLWDFPQGTLSRREVAAHDISRALGLDVVPLTVWTDGPLGEGSAQQWIPSGPSDLIDVLAPEEVDQTWLPVMEAEDMEGNPLVVAHRDDERLRRLCLFDLIINNSDRKGGHVLGDGDAVLGVDHGVSLHVDDKVRTVLWGFVHDPFTEGERRVLEAARRMDMAVPQGITQEEWEALGARVDALLALGAFPEPSGTWPSVPWPPL